jgi:hypothetical protein
LCEEYDKKFSNFTSNNIENQKLIQQVNNTSSSGFSFKKLFSNSTPLKDTSSPSTSTSTSTSATNLCQNFIPTFYKGSSCYKFLWIRMALLNKSLPKIIDYLVEEETAIKYYQIDNSIIGHPVHGKIFASLLVGPCALDFTRMKSCDYIWSDPNADELIQRHKMHSYYYSNNNNSTHHHYYHQQPQQQQQQQQHHSHQHQRNDSIVLSKNNINTFILLPSLLFLSSKSDIYI